MIGFFQTRQEKVPKKKERSVTTVDYSLFGKEGCSSCSLRGACITHKMKSSGAENPLIYFLGEAPGAEEDEVGIPFVGRSGKLLRKTISDSFEGKVRFGNTVRCRPPGNRTPTISEVEHCRKYVEKDILRFRPKVVVGLGGVALDWMVKEVGITYWRGKTIPCRIEDHSFWFCPTLHPSFILRGGGRSWSEEDISSDEWLRCFERDIWQAEKLSFEDPPQILTKEELDNSIVGVENTQNGFSVLNRMLDEVEESKRFAIDLETYRTRPYAEDAVILSVALSWRKDKKLTTLSFPYQHPSYRWMKDKEVIIRKRLISLLLQHKIKIAHNASFELEWLGYFLDKRILDSPSWHCTMNFGYILDERRGHSLNSEVLEHLGLHLKQLSNVNRDDLRPLSLPHLLMYNGRDAGATFLLHSRQQVILRSKGLKEVAYFHIKRLPTLVRTQMIGLPVDFDAVNSLMEEVSSRLKDILVKIQHSSEARLFQKRMGNDFNPFSSANVTVLFRDLLHRVEGRTRKNKSGYGTAEEVLKAIGTPFSQLLLDVRATKKLVSTYLKGYLPSGKYVYSDGRVHSSFNSTLTATGRLSSTDPNLQNFPKKKNKSIRRLIIPPPNCLLVAVDYGQIEARGIGMHSQDQVLIKALWERYDIHLDWAERVAKKHNGTYIEFGSDITNLRSVTKNKLVFPAFYGAQSPSIARSLCMPERKAQELLEEFWSIFSGVKKWQDRLIEEYNERGYVEALTGRRRHAPLSRNMIFNSPIQGMASDIVVDAMTRLDVYAAKSDNPFLHAVINIHDDLSFFLPKKNLDDNVSSIIKLMVSVPFSWVCVPISVEVSCGPNWYDQEKIGVFSSDELENEKQSSYS